MRILFVDGTFTDYTPATPAQRPLGGMQSALCYLAIALLARGHSVALFNRGNRGPGQYAGVWCAGFEALSTATLNSFDAVVSISTGSITFRQFGLIRPLVLWTGHDTDRAAVEALRDDGERFLWDKIVMVSDWQAGRYCQAFRIKREQIAVLRNAIAPAFENVVRKQPYFFEAGRPPILYYSSTPYRGLDVLLSAFPLVRALVPGCEARIYSSMNVYQTPPSQDPHHALYDRCRATEGVRYVGSVGQAVLAQAAGKLDVFAYPSTYQETSCIALMEAMAAGCLIASVAFGALPETAAGFASLLERPAGIANEQFAQAYARFTAQVINDACQRPAQTAVRLDEQRRFALKNYTWSVLAQQWETLLQDVAKQPVRSTLPARTAPCPCGSGKRFKRCCGAPA